MNNDHTAHRSRIGRFHTVKPHVALTCIVLREDCLAHRTPFGPESHRCPQGLNFKSRDNSLSALEPSDPCPMYIGNFRMLPFLIRFCEEQIQYCPCERRHLEFVLPLPRFVPGTDNSICLRGSPSTTCSSDSAEDCGNSVSVDVCHTDFSLGISKREHRFPVSVSERKQGFSLDASRRGQGFSSNITVREHHRLHCVVSVQRLSRNRGFTRSRSSSPPPTICETCTWLPQSFSDLFYGRRRVSGGNWPVHGRCRESSRVVPPVRPGFRDSRSSQQMWLRHLSLAFSKFAEGYLPHEAVVPELPYARVVSNGLSMGRAQEHVVNTQLGLGRCVLEKL